MGIHMKLQGKHAFVTAAAQGIGYAIVIPLVEEGATVTAVDLNREALDRAFIDNSNVDRVVLDMTDSESVRKAMAKILSIDILVNCLGWVDVGSILDCNEESFDKSLKLDVVPAYIASQEAIRKALSDERSLSIMNISSVIPSISSAPERFAYATTKAALIGMTKSIAIDFIRKGVRCNAVCPGTIASPSLLERMAATVSEGELIDEARKRFDERQPIGRMGTPKEVADMVLYLSSDSSSFISGSIFTIDGGWSV
tara:strand:+ start:277 stop:1041 length:765 start_codon:yes stop_codon:yes gene_type:complete